MEEGNPNPMIKRRSTNSHPQIKKKKEWETLKTTGKSLYIFAAAATTTATPGFLCTPVCL